MKATATFHIAKADLKWRGVVNHVKHIQGQHHRNKDIDFSLTKYNEHLNALVAKRHYIDALYKQDALAKFVKEHDAKVIKQGHKDRAYGSVKGWLKKQKSAERVGLVTFGNLDTKETIMAQTGMSKEEFAQISTKAFKKWIISFNRAYQGIKLAHAVINVDELGAPHAHIAIRSLSFSDKGKPSVNFDKAIARELGVKGSSKQALSRFRQQEDQRIIDAFNDAFKEKGIQFQLQRTNSSIHGLSMETFKDMKHKEDSQKERQKELETAQNELAQREADLTQQREALAKREEEMREREKKMREREEELKKQKEQALKATSDFYDKVNSFNLNLAYTVTEYVRDALLSLQNHMYKGDCPNNTIEQLNREEHAPYSLTGTRKIFYDLAGLAIKACAKTQQKYAEKLKNEVYTDWEKVTQEHLQESAARWRMAQAQQNNYYPRTAQHVTPQPQQQDDGMDF